jgi:TPR repeat protein
MLMGSAASDPFREAVAAYMRGDYATALRIFQPIAGSGDATSELWMGTMYERGLAVPQDYSEAAKWYRRAAEQGHGQAQLNLALMYSEGKGVPLDYVQAHMWANLATVHIRANAEIRQAFANVRDEIASKMTPTQIAEAQRLAREWKPKKTEPTP